jgi:hypothetical protein
MPTFRLPSCGNVLQAINLWMAFTSADREPNGIVQRHDRSIKRAGGRAVLHLDTFFRLASCPVAFQLKLELPPSLGSPDTLKSPVVLPTPK